MPKIREPLKKVGGGIKNYLGKVKRAPGDLVEDTKFRVKEGLKSYGRKFGIGGKETLAPDFVKKYRESTKAQGEHPLDTINRVIKKRRTSDGYMNVRGSH